MIRVVPAKPTTWRGKPVPDAFVRFSRGFHQDTFVISQTLEDAVAFAIRMVPVAEHPALTAYLQKLLNGKYNDSDLKGLWNRTPSAVFFKSHGVRQILELGLALLTGTKT